MDERQSSGDRRRRFEPVMPWTAGPAWGAALVAVYLVLACLPAGLALAVRPGSNEPAATEFGLAAGLVGFALLALQPVLAGRLRVLDAPFGLDMVMRFHEAMAVLAAVLLCAHPVLLMVGAGNAHLLAFDTPWPVWLGKAGAILLVFGVGYAVLVRLSPLEYQTWRRLHKGMVAVVILGFVHAVLIGDDLRQPVVLVYFSALFAVAAGVYAWRNTVVPFTRRRFHVADVQQASHDTWTLRLEPADGGDLPARNPGQFMFLKLLRPGRVGEEHPFTISASPTEPGCLAATIKESGDFTNTIGQTKAGDEARIEQPFGRFSFVHHEAEAFVFVAGGVGITPIRSMLRCLADRGDDRPAVLICGNRTEGDILFRDELAGLPENVRVVHVLSAAGEDWDGETGLITREVIERHAGELLERAEAYVCGPPPMRDMVVKALRQLGVPFARMHYERFSL